jgi:hypothetical protein
MFSLGQRLQKRSQRKYELASNLAPEMEETLAQTVQAA